MPRYSYSCGHCRTETELQRPVDWRDHPVVCPKCSWSMHRLPAAPGFALKGGGWFKDGYEKGTAE